MADTEAVPAPATPLQEPEASGDTPAADADETEKKQKPKKEKKPPKEKKPQGGKKETKLGLHAKKSEEFGDWYSQVCTESEMITYYEGVSGCYILRPHAMAVWEVIQMWFDSRIRKMGVQNSYFPLFVTEAALTKEKDHVEGFAAEVAWVTRSGQSELEMPLAIRPTSETVMYPYYAQWIRSHRDLPLKLNQWTNVVRWEFKHPTPFIRSREFLWQEGHTAHATKPEAELEVRQILDLYKGVYEELLCVPVIQGVKSKAEKFAGSLYSTTVEAFVPSTGRGIQGATSHCLGQNFAKMFEIEFEAEDKSKQLVWQNSWGLTTRSIGVMIMVHGDDKGLVLPPRVAPCQVICIPIPNSKLTDEQRTGLTAKIDEITLMLEDASVRAKSDTSENHTPGWKYNHWELKGVPIRLEIGQRDMDSGKAVLVRRDTGEKIFIEQANLLDEVKGLLDKIQADMLQRAREEHAACVETAKTWDEFMAALGRKHCALIPWADEEEIEEDIKKRSATGDAMGAKSLCIPFDQPEMPEGTLCIASGKPAVNWGLFGRSY